MSLVVVLYETFGEQISKKLQKDVYLRSRRKLCLNHRKIIRYAIARIIEMVSKFDTKLFEASYGFCELILIYAKRNMLHAKYVFRQGLAAKHQETCRPPHRRLTLDQTGIPLARSSSLT